MKIKDRKKNNSGPVSTYNKQGGFTLVELMVATFIFMAIMLASMGALLVTIDGARNARGLRTAMDNVNFAMESMTRSIRMGTHYYCAESIPMTGSEELLNTTQDCPAGTVVAFLPQKSDPNNLYRVGYRWVPDEKKLQRCEGADECVDIVAPEVLISKLNFVVKNSSTEDNNQASVYIIMKGEVNVKGVLTPFAIQTMASQRNF